MKINIFIFSLLISFFACTPAKEVLTSEVLTSNYEAVPMNAKLSEYIGKKIYFKAKVCDFEMQHMLRFSLDESNLHFCIDQISDDGKAGFQILAYTTEAKMKLIGKYNDKTFTVYGTLNSTSGAGKGGKEHTEYYLEFDKSELK